MASAVEISQFAHRANILRFKKILATHLMADQERRLIEDLLAEEQAARQQSTGSVRPEYTYTLIHAA